MFSFASAVLANGRKAALAPVGFSELDLRPPGAGASLRLGGPLMVAEKSREAHSGKCVCADCWSKRQIEIAKRAHPSNWMPKPELKLIRGGKA